MTNSLTFDYPFTADITAHDGAFMYRQMGIDTIQLIAKYETVVNMVERMGLSVAIPSKNSPVSETIQKLQDTKEDKKRLKQDQFKPVSKVVKLTKGKSLSNYMIITQNTPFLFDHAEHHKKAKDTYCLITFAGLHQPSKKVESEAMKIISKFLKRKAFKLYSLDVAIDTKDPKSVTHNRKGAFKDNLMPYSKHGVISKGSSLYINITGHPSISRILYYDKFLKQTQHHKQGGISERNWKRLEVTVTFDVTDRNNKGFMHYLESLNFINDLWDIDEIAGLAGIRRYDRSYLEYQINAMIDNRFMNNHESSKQFNSGDALERFKVSEFRRFTIPM